MNEEIIRVSVPLRGSDRETRDRGRFQTVSIFVSVPLRGSDRETREFAARIN